MLNLENLDYKSIVSDILSNYENTTILNLSLKGIALLGKMRSGKDTIADYAVEKYGFKKYAFGDALKFYAHLYVEVDTNSKPRALYQEFGQNCRKIDENIWIKCLIGTLNKEKPNHFIIADLRQPNERLFAYEKHKPVIRVVSNIKERFKRMKDAGDSFTMSELNHETERWYDILTADYRIENNGPIEAATNQFDDIITNQLLHLFW